MQHVPSAVYIELGKAGVTDEEAQALIVKAGKLADEQHQMGAEGRVPIPNTKRVLVYNGGIDGMDWRVYIEDKAVKTAHELVKDMHDILYNYRKQPVSPFSGGGPYTLDWQEEATRYLEQER